MLKEVTQKVGKRVGGDALAPLGGEVAGLGCFERSRTAADVAAQRLHHPRASAGSSEHAALVAALKAGEWRLNAAAERDHLEQIAHFRRREQFLHAGGQRQISRSLFG